MEERRVRLPAGRKGDGTIHRVGLTRHCLASGSIQLPFALRDALPEGEIVVLDVARDERFSLVSHPPRRLSGLGEFFAAHELQVNDLLEIHAAEAGLRLACVRSARPARDEERGTGDAGIAPQPEAAGRASAGTTSPRHEPVGGRPVRAEPAFVERIGSVTVRRLGTAAFAPSSEDTLRRERPAAEEAGPGVADAAVVEERDAVVAEGYAQEAPAAPEAPAAEARADDAVVGSARPEAARDPVSADVGGQGRSRNAAAAARPTSSGAFEPSTAPVSSAPSGATPRSSTSARSRPAPPRARGGEASYGGPGDIHESDLVDATQVANSAPWSVRDATERAPSRRTDPTAAAAFRGRAPAESGAAAAVEERDRPARAPAPQGASRPSERREREEALSRAGDLRSRIVRWLLDPATPVIVQYEAVQERFELSADVARDVLAGILESPPPSLRITVLREGMIRVSRATVVQEV